MRRLIVNADDFGQSASINRGVIEAQQNGIVTSASLMVRWPHAAQAAEYARSKPAFSIGLHVDLGEWILQRGDWTLAYEVVPLDNQAAVADEVERQLDRFFELMGLLPTHIDSHQHVHQREPAQSIVLGIAEDLGIPCREFSVIAHCGKFYGQSRSGRLMPELISAEALAKLLCELPEGITELSCHPGLGVAEDLRTTYAGEREQEVRALCAPSVKQAIEQERIVLTSFRGIEL